MSLIVNGEPSLIKKVSTLLLNYKALCANDSQIEETDAPILNLVTKYYSASVTMDLVDLSTTDESVLDNAEGYILVPSEGDLSLPAYALSRAAVDVDTGLRILVALMEGSEIAHRAAYEAWALENSFEYVEINTLDPVKDHHEREKVGLPRLMEALESNMWSTMQRAPKAAPASSSSSHRTAENAAGASADASVVSNEQNQEASSSTGGYIAPAVPGSSTNDFLQDLPVPPVSTINATATAAVATTATDNASTPLDPFDLDLEDKEDNEIIDKYANFISEVKNFRSQATGGQLSDQARRDQAADMAMKLAMLMGMDDDSDSGSD